MTSPERITCSITTAILAGGAALRLGGNDKGLYPLLGRPLIEWVIEALPAIADERILIVANRNIERYARYAQTISDSAQGYGGPLAGVAAALSVCESPWLFTVPVDCVRPHPALRLRLLQAATGRNAQAVVAYDGARRQPLFALYRRELADSAARALADGHGVSQWQDLVGAREVDLSDLHEAWINLNTPDDFVAFAETWRAG